MYIWSAIANCRRFDEHCTRTALRRALFSAGSSTEISTAMMPITTSSSTSVKPRMIRPRGRGVRMGRILSDAAEAGFVLQRIDGAREAACERDARDGEFPNTGGRAEPRFHPEPRMNCETDYFA